MVPVIVRGDRKQETISTLFRNPRKTIQVSAWALKWFCVCVRVVLCQEIITVPAGFLLKIDRNNYFQKGRLHGVCYFWKYREFAFIQLHPNAKMHRILAQNKNNYHRFVCSQERFDEKINDTIEIWINHFIWKTQGKQCVEKVEVRQLKFCSERHYCWLYIYLSDVIKIQSI